MKTLPFGIVGDAWIGIAPFTPDNQTSARAAAIWHSLAESQDVLAEEGLAFLQGQFGARTTAV